MADIPGSLLTNSGAPKDELKRFRKESDATKLKPSKALNGVKVYNVYNSFVPYLANHLYAALDDKSTKIIHFELNPDTVVYFAPATNGAILEVFFYDNAKVKIVKDIKTKNDTTITNYIIEEVSINDITSGKVSILETYSPRHPQTSYSY